MASAKDDSKAMQSTDAPLQMDYWSEGLSESQKSHYSKSQKEYSEIMRRVSDFIFKEKGEVLERGNDVLVLQGSTATPPKTALSSLVSSTVQPSTAHSLNNQVVSKQAQPQMPKLHAVPAPQLLLQAGQAPPGARVVATQAQTAGTFQTPQGTFQLVMDPRSGIIVGAVPSQPGGAVLTTSAATATAAAPAAAPAAASAISTVTATVTATATLPTLVTTPSASIQPTPATQRVRPKPSAQIVKPTAAPAVSDQTPAVTTAITAPTTPSLSTTIATPSSSQQVPKKKPSAPSVPKSAAIEVKQSSRPNANENTSVGGLSAGNSKKTLNDDGKTTTSGPDSKELTFNKLSGKTFPSLVVLAKPYMRSSDMTQVKINRERSTLDAKVKCVLMFTPAKFCEWLIQQGLVKGEQFCTQHSREDGPLPLKLGTYSDVTKFPYSGGYVWVNDCCPQTFVSVFSGSIFEGAPHPPSVLLKLMYHWCCQTNVQNVVQWVKVDNFYVKNFYTYMRSVCIAAVHENFQKLGGPHKRVEVGVISLGTTSQDGNQRQVKVEVLGVMDTESKEVRLRAVEPLQEADRTYKRRFVKILEPLRHWVHLDSTIVTDFTVDKGTLLTMGFNQVHQSTIPDPPSLSSNKLGNQNIMEYLRRIVPRMFQNTLSLLSRQIIQQFLDELVWRELWGPIPSQAFDSLVSNLAAQTKIDSGDSLIVKLGKIAANPFRSWEYKHWKINGLDIASTMPPDVSAAISKSLSKPTDTLLVEDEYSFSIALPKPYNHNIDEELDRRMNLELKKIDTNTTLRKLVEIQKFPRSLLYARAKEFLKFRVVPPQSVFTEDEEEDVKEYLMTLYEWGYPLGRRDVQMTVKQYLDTCERVETRFKDNFPGEMWLERFLTRHPLIRARLCENVPSRGSPIDPEAVKQYLLNISTELESVPPQNILNFMEIGLTGDPVKSMSIELRDLRYPIGRRKVKSSTAIMVACTPGGTVLPIFIIFDGKAPTTIEKGDFPGEYYATPTGWFDETAFLKWMETVLFPWADRLQGKKVVIGDSLAKLFTVKSLALCMDKNITFVSMPCNISGVLSPIDVVLCEKLRTQWRALMRAWALSNGDKCIAMENYPCHIQELFTSTIGSGMGQNIRNAFKVIGLHPFNSKNTMRALENAGVNLNDAKQSNESTGDASKRKRIFIGTDDLPVRKRSEQKTGDTAKEILKTSNDLMHLVAFYYGTLPPINELLSSEFKTEILSIKCPSCHSMVQDNLTLMKHLLGHSSVPTREEISDLNMCIYCTDTFPSKEEANDHVQKVHKSLSFDETACLICSERLESKENLVFHMRRVHCQLELPFVCAICNFRCSQQFKLVDHFYEVHKNGEKLQCPHCLKCVAVANMGKKLAANVIFFMQHVKKHQSSPNSKKCDRCSLMFIHKGIMKEHLNSDHISFCDNPNIVPFVCESKVSIMIPRPKMQTTETVPEAKVSKKINVSANGIGSEYSCIECHSSLFEEEHFLNYLSCEQCSFSTFCSRAMNKHSIGKVRTHPGGCKPGSIRTAPLKALPYAMHCMCGFQSRDGNTLATHLISCNRTVAYPTASSAVEALVASRLSASFASLASGKPGKAYSRKENGKKIQNKHLQKDPSTSLSKLSSAKSMEGETARTVPTTETEDDSSRDRPLSRASNSSSSSYNRKRSALEAEIDLPIMSMEAKEMKSDKDDTLESHSQSEINHSS